MLRSLLVVALAACGGTSARPPATTPSTPKPIGSPIAAPRPQLLPTTPVLPAALGPTSVVAKIDGNAVTLADLHVQRADNESMEVARYRALTEYIERKLISSAAFKDFVVVTDAEVDSAIADIKQQNNINDQELAAALEQQGYTLARYRDELREQITALRYIRTQEPKLPMDQARAKVMKKLRAAVKVEILIAEPKPRAPTTATASSAGPLFTTADLAKILKDPLPAFEQSTLAGEPDTAEYQSNHWKAVGKAESFDLAYRVWHPGKAKLHERYDELLTQIPDTKPNDKVSFRVFDKAAKIYGYGFIDEAHEAVALVTCGNDLCKSEGDIAAIAKLLASRIK